MVAAATDNRNRTVSEIRHVFSKNGGNLGELGSVSWMFERKSQILIEKDKATEDQLMELALEAGADDVKLEGEHWEILSAPESHHAVLEALEKAGIPTASAEIGMIPKNLVEVDPKNMPGVMKLMEALEEHDDVQNVYTNADFGDEAGE
jgi:YebC/PmpR family DNA-binding regulatory protein